MTKDWLDFELKFVSWLYKYKNFLGRLKVRDFKQFASKDEAINAYINETIKEVRKDVKR